ncbi:MAG: hypothetical protein JWO83_2435 [Caulobacteraceae bacterium]|nr:hypothetical protein [Caulobacteraceae bacterium]
MPELQSNGSYDPYLAQLFNPLGGGAQVNPAIYGATGANGIGGAWGGIGAGAIPNLGQTQHPLGAQNPWAAQPASSPLQSLIVIQLAQQIVARQAAQAIQCVQALQTLLQQALSQGAGGQAQFGFGQPQPLQQLMQYLAMQPSAPFRFGLAA